MKARASHGRRPILILSAFAPELAPLRLALERAYVGPSRVSCVAAGIGVVDAALGAARAITACRPRLVLFLGTAGCYQRHPRPGGVVIAHRIRLASSAVARGDGYFPGPMVAQSSTEVVLRRALARAAGPQALVADVATPLAITKGIRLASLLMKKTSGIVAENLEVFAVARACELAGLPFGAVLGISNRVGPRAHLEWLRHQAKAIEAASLCIQGYLAQWGSLGKMGKFGFGSIVTDS